ncbi:MAG: pyridoxal phosphate-dependent aminotransferase [Gemmatimonadaceae bacterium]
MPNEPVATADRQRANAPSPAWIDARLRGQRASATLAIHELSNRLQYEGRTVFKLGMGQSPFPVPERVVEALKASAHQNNYLPVKGLPELCAAVAEHHRARHGLGVTADDVVIGPGSKELIFLTQLVLDAELFVPSPSWVSYVPQARLANRQVTWIATQRAEHWHLTPNALSDALERAAPGPKLLILNSPNNPNGYNIERETLEGLAHVAREHGIIVIADEIYGLLDHSGDAASFATFYPEGTVVSSGLSKWCGAGGWRLGTFTFAPRLRWLLDALAVAASETYTAVSAPIQYAAVTAFRGGDDIVAYLDGARAILRALGTRCATMLQAVAADVAPPHGGFYLFPDCTPLGQQLGARGLRTGPDLCSRMLQETGVATLPGSAFGRPAEELTLRLSYVDFDGARALAAVRETGIASVDDAFLDAYCARVVEAIDRMTRWLAGT